MATSYLGGRRKVPLHTEGQAWPLTSTNKDGIEFFYETFSITSAAAATAVNIIPDARVGANRKVYLLGFAGKVDGATVWATTATVKIQDTNGTPIDFVTAAVAAMTANADIVPGTADVALEDAFNEASGGTLAKGLQVKGDANGTGSTFKGFVFGIIK